MSDNKPSSPDISMLDEQQSAQALLNEYRGKLAALDNSPGEARAHLLLDIAEALLSLERKTEAWDAAREAFDIFLKQENWQGAVESCSVMFQTDQADAISALGQGIWLAVTFPIEAATTVAVLQNLIEETPANADGAAVAAATAHYIANLRSENEEKRASLTFLTGHLLGQVAQRHSGVQSQTDFDHWLTRLQLNDPQLFLPKLATVINVLVEDKWWFDRDHLRSKLPTD
ncbi:MAG: hypothetical protein OEY07_06615 [Gammaproteobacteria bacterium]|nr:hypothetical protein [Gammaproteobacteria bacterium]